MYYSKVGFRRGSATEHLWWADEDKSPTTRRSATNDRDEEGNRNPQRVAQEGDKEKDVVRANLGELDKEQTVFRVARWNEEKHQLPPGWLSSDDRKWL
jgi:hypothetical protein